MDGRAIRSVVWAQVIFCAGLLVAILLKPAGLAANDGISYYGIYARTFIPFAVSLLGGTLYFWQAARYIHNKPLMPLRHSLMIVAALIIVIVFTPYSVNHALDYLHTAAGSALFSLQLLLSGWLAVKLHYNVIAVCLTIAELAAGVACAIYLRPTHGLLIQAQIIFQLVFGALLIYSLGCIRRNESISD